MINIIIAWRRLRKDKEYIFSNVLGLSVALAVAILSFVYLSTQLNYESNYSNSERIFRINSDLKIGDQTTHSAQTSDVLGPLFTAQIPEIEYHTRLFVPDQTFKIRKGHKFLKESAAAFSDTSLFSVFDIPVLKKNAAKLLLDPNSVIISKSAAEKYFPDGHALGQTLEIDDLSFGLRKSGMYEVAAVYDDFPVNTHLNFDFIFSATNLEYRWGENFAGFNFHTYILLEKGADYRFVNEQIEAITRTTIFPILSQQLGVSYSWNQFNEVGNSLSFSLFPIADIHLHSDRVGEIGQNGSRQTIAILIVLSFFVLLMSCVNYVNLSTTQWMSRAREIGVRKVLGSSRKSLILQFLSESLLIVSTSAVIAVFIAFICLPFFNEVLSSSITENNIFRWSTLAFLVLIAATVVWPVPHTRHLIYQNSTFYRLGILRRQP